MDSIKKNLDKYRKEFGRLGSREKIVILSILLFSFFAGIFGATNYHTWLTKNTSLFQEKVTPTPLPSPASLSIVQTKTQEITKGSAFDITIRLNSYNQGVQAADFIITFDPRYLQAATVSSGSFFHLYPKKDIGENFVKISAMASFSDKKIVIPKGEGVVADVTFQALDATPSTKIKFDREKTVVAVDGNNILGDIKDLEIQIK